jgi:hypothetical protein
MRIARTLQDMGHVMPVKGLSARKLTRSLHMVLVSEGMRACGLQVASRFAQRQDPAERRADLERRLASA